MTPTHNNHLKNTKREDLQLLTFLSYSITSFLFPPVSHLEELQQAFIISVQSLKFLWDSSHIDLANTLEGEKEWKRAEDLEEEVHVCNVAFFRAVGTLRPSPIIAFEIWQTFNTKLSISLFQPPLYLPP